MQVPDTVEPLKSASLKSVITTRERAPSTIIFSNPAGVCIQELAAMIQNPDRWEAKNTRNAESQ